MKLLVTLALVFLVGMNAVRAADQWDILFSYNTGMPSGNLNEYIDAYSWVGFGGELSYHLDDFNTVGLHSGWQRFDVFHRDASIDISNGTIFGSQVRTVSAVPLILTASHTLADPIAKVKPYMRIGAGMYFMTRDFEIGMYSFSNGTTHFGLMPAFGVDFRLDRKSYLTLQLDYNIAFDSGETLSGADENTYSWLGIKAGFRFGQ